MEILEKIFGSSVKVRLMRSFVYNSNTVFDVVSLARKIKSRPNIIKKEINCLEKAGLIKRRQTRNESGRKVTGFIVNHNFIYLKALREFLQKISPLTEDVIAKKVSTIGRVKLVVVSGVFLSQDESRVDMLLVSERPDEKKLKKVLVDFESEFGREMAYAIMSSDDFVYRLQMGDKLVRDVFDFPHRVILDKLGLS